MLSSHSRIRLALSLFVLALGGCLAQRSDVREGTRDTIGAVKDAKSELSQEHLRAALGDIEGLKSEIDRGDKRMADLYEEANRRYIEQKAAEERLASLSDVALRAADLVSGGRASLFVKSIEKDFQDTNTRIDEKAGQAKAGVDLALNESKATQQRVADLEERTAKLDEVFKALNSDTREKLAKLDTGKLEELAREVNDPERFKAHFRTLATEMGLSERDTNKILGLSPEEIMALLLAGGGSVFVSRKLSKSQPQIDDLWERIAKIEGRGPGDQGTSGSTSKSTKES